MSDTTTLAEALPKELARVREVLGHYKAMGPVGMFGAAFIEHDLREADAAMASGDLVAMIRAFKKLQEIEAVRSQHKDFVFVYRRERVKNTDQAPKMPYRPIETMNNTAWQNARKAAGLGDLHVHDLRHTVGMRLREAGVAEGTISDILWHSTKTMTQHYSVAQIVELHQALDKVKDDAGRWNKSLATLRREQEATRVQEVKHLEVANG